MKYLIIFFICWHTYVSGQSPKVFTLEQCIDTAIRKNLQVQQSGIQARTNRVNWNTAKMNMLPNLIGGASSGINSGRNIDPSTNNYVSEEIKFSSYSLSTGVVLFNGWALQQTASQNKLYYEAADMEWQQQKNNITLNIILAYLNVLSNEDVLTQAMQQSQLSYNQVQRLQTLNTEGAISPYLLSDLLGQYENDQLIIIDAKNKVAAAKIDLFRLMNIPYPDSVTIQRVDTAQLIQAESRTPGDTYNDALQNFAQIKANDLRREGAEHGVKAAKGNLFPVLGFTGRSSTTYSSGTNAKYGAQLNNNLFSNYALNLDIPIFNRSFYRNNVKLAKLTLENSKVVASSSRTALQQDIWQAHANMQASQERYGTLVRQANAYMASFKSAEIRFNEGVINSVDYLTAKNNLDKANTNLIAARYDFVLRKKILDYYSGTLQTGIN